MKNFSTSSALFSRNLSLNLGGRVMDLSTPVVMGIINATPDSFYEGSRIPEPAAAVEKAGMMLREGAAILDIGAASSRPGAPVIPENEELSRLVPVVEAIRSGFPEAPLSVDTWRAAIARSMVENYNVNMVNDISAGDLDPEMFPTLASLQVPYVAMHMQGTPESMQDSPEYRHVVDDLLQFFGKKVHQLRKLGVNDVVIDPGFGFGKSLEQNYQLLRELDAFAILEIPVMVGISRKSMIYKVLETNPGKALNGTTAAHMAALMGGASILRVHDVREAVETVKIYQQIVKNY